MTEQDVANCAVTWRAFTTVPHISAAALRDLLPVPSRTRAATPPSMERQRLPCSLNCPGVPVRPQTASLRRCDFRTGTAEPARPGAYDGTSRVRSHVIFQPHCGWEKMQETVHSKALRYELLMCNVWRVSPAQFLKDCSVCIALVSDRCLTT